VVQEAEVLEVVAEVVKEVVEVDLEVPLQQPRALQIRARIFECLATD